NFNCRGFGPLLEDKLCLIFKLAPSVCRMTFPILASLLVRLVVLLQIGRASCRESVGLGGGRSNKRTRRESARRHRAHGERARRTRSTRAGAEQALRPATHVGFTVS